MMTKDFTIQVKNTLVAHKKKIASIVVIAILLGVLAVGAHAMFEVKGIVTSVNNNSITVADFLRTQTVDLTGYPANIADIKPGDMVKIKKNLQGNVIYLRVFSPRDGECGTEREHD